MILQCDLYVFGKLFDIFLDPIYIGNKTLQAGQICAHSKNTTDRSAMLTYTMLDPYRWCWITPNQKLKGNREFTEWKGSMKSFSDAEIQPFDNDIVNQCIFIQNNDKTEKTIDITKLKSAKQQTSTTTNDTANDKEKSSSKKQASAEKDKEKDSSNPKTADNKKDDDKNKKQASDKDCDKEKDKADPKSKKDSEKDKANKSSKKEIRPPIDWDTKTISKENALIAIRLIDRERFLDIVRVHEGAEDDNVRCENEKCTIQRVADVKCMDCQKCIHKECALEVAEERLHFCTTECLTNYGLGEFRRWNNDGEFILSVNRCKIPGCTRPMGMFEVCCAQCEDACHQQCLETRGQMMFGCLFTCSEYCRQDFESYMEKKQSALDEHKKGSKDNQDQTKKDKKKYCAWKFCKILNTPMVLKCRRCKKALHGRCSKRLIEEHGWKKDEIFCGAFCQRVFTNAKLEKESKSKTRQNKMKAAQKLVDEEFDRLQTQNPDYMYPSANDAKAAPLNFDGAKDINYIEQFNLNTGADDEDLILSWNEIRNKVKYLLRNYNIQIQDAFDAACLSDIDRNCRFDQETKKLFIRSGYALTDDEQQGERSDWIAFVDNQEQPRPIVQREIQLTVELLKELLADCPHRFDVLCPMGKQPWERIRNAAKNLHSYAITGWGQCDLTWQEMVNIACFVDRGREFKINRARILKPKKKGYLTVLCESYNLPEQYRDKIPSNRPNTDEGDLDTVVTVDEKKMLQEIHKTWFFDYIHWFNPDLAQAIATDLNGFVVETLKNADVAHKDAGSEYNTMDFGRVQSKETFFSLPADHKRLTTTDLWSIREEDGSEIPLMEIKTVTNNNRQLRKQIVWTDFFNQGWKEANAKFFEGVVRPYIDPSTLQKLEHAAKFQYQFVPAADLQISAVKPIQINDNKRKRTVWTGMQGHHQIYLENRWVEQNVQKRVLKKAKNRF